MDSAGENSIVEEQKAEEEERRKSPYRSFTQFNDRQLGSIRWLTKEDPVAAEVLWFLIEHMSTVNAVACSYSILEKVTGKSRTTVYRALKLLREKQFLDSKRVGNMNIYHVNTNLVWHSYGKNLHYAELRAAILLDPEENPGLKVNQGRVNVVQQLELPMGEIVRGEIDDEPEHLRSLRERQRQQFGNGFAEQGETHPH